MNKSKLIVALTLALTGAIVPATAEAIPVSLELALLVDVSTSVNATEFNLQKTAYVDAFKNPSLQSEIESIGGIAVSFIQWSGDTQQRQSVGWTLVNNATSATAFANAVNNAPRAFSGGTSPAPAINFATSLFSGNGFEGQRLIMDIASDGGGQTTEKETTAARKAAFAAGVTTINGIVISDLASVANFFTNDIIGGADAFLLQVDDFSKFRNAALEKLEREIGWGSASRSSSQVPLPGSMSLIALGLLGLGAHRRWRS